MAKHGYWQLNYWDKEQKYFDDDELLDRVSQLVKKSDCKDFVVSRKKGDKEELKPKKIVLIVWNGDVEKILYDLEEKHEIKTGPSDCAIIGREDDDKNKKMVLLYGNSGLFEALKEYVKFVKGE